MKTVNVEMFEAEDGKRFDTKNECIRYEIFALFSKEYSSRRLVTFTGKHGSIVSAETVFDWLYENKQVVLNALNALKAN